jgi:hypothetical protein
VIWSSAPSVASCQPAASSLLRWYCWVAASVWRSAIACVVPNGSSDGRSISRLEAIFDCVRARRLLAALRSASTLRCVIECVMRVFIVRPDPSG